VQFAGDYREAHNRLQSGGLENYYAQRYSMECGEELAGKTKQTGVLCFLGESHDEVLSNGVRSMNAGLSTPTNLDPVISKIEAFRPTHIILTTPQIPILKWGLAQRVEMMAQLADSFALTTQGLSPIRKLVRRAKHFLRNRKLAGLLNDSRIRCVSNHHIGSCEDLVRIGVDPRKVIPWHWPPMQDPASFPTKSGPGAGDAWKLCFVGSIIETKGIGDAIEAVGSLRQRGRNVRLTVLGGGEIERFSQLARDRGVADSVIFEGRQAHRRVIEVMAASHLVLVLSHHNYPEGMPMVIQEGLSTRTPLICSDHPMFRGQVWPEATRTVPERNPLAITDAIEAVLGDPKLYETMSATTPANFNDLQAPPRWHEVFTRWLARSPENDRWLAEHSLASGIYGSGRK
jgi:glycosyltransferase involved in cell wall biosynthesis